MKIAHAADIHIRGLARHAEYRTLLRTFISDVREQGADVLVIAGDVFHSKISGMTPEYVSLLSEFVRALSAEIPLTYITLGNHDGNLSNQERLDSVSPIVAAVGAKNVICCRDSGAYPLPMGELHVFSLFDRRGWATLAPRPGQLCVASFHGPVGGAVTDVGWEIDDAEVTLERFSGYDLLLLGDIHKRQIFSRLGAPWGAYPGSLIQQNYGEDPEKGYLLWEISGHGATPSVEFRQIHNSMSFVTLRAEDVAAGAIAPDSRRYRIIAKRADGARADAVAAELKASGVADVVVQYEDDVSTRLADSASADALTPSRLVDIAADMGYDVGDRAEAIEIVDNALRDASSRAPERRKWSLRALQFDNVLSYGAQNFVSFDEFSGIVGLFSPNGTGKSSFVGAISYALFNESDRNRAKSSMIVNKNSDHCFARAIIDVDGTTYAVERQTVKVVKRDGGDASQTQLNIFRITDDETVDTCGEQRSDTEKFLRSLIGDPDDCKTSSIATQGNLTRFIDDGPAPRRAALSRALGLSFLDDVYKSLYDRVLLKRGELRSIAAGDSTGEIAAERVKIAALHAELASLAAKRDELLELQRSLESQRARAEAQVATERRAREISEEIGTIERKLVTKQTRDRSDIARDIDAASRRAEDVAALEKHDAVTAATSKLIASKRRSMTVLRSVPCGGSFQSCQFIKDAVAAAATVVDDERRLTELDAARPVVREYCGPQLSELRRELRDADAAAAATAAREALEARRAILKQELLSLGDCSSNASAVISELTAVARAIRATDESTTSAKRSLDSSTVRVERLERDQLKRAELLESARKADQLATAFSRKGVPLSILRSRLDVINAAVGELLESSVGISARAHIDGDELQIEVQSASTRVPIELACGAEKFFVALAFRMAMAKLSPASADFFIIDEGFGSLDDSGLEGACKLLSLAKSMFSFVIVVSHVDYVKDVADHFLEIVTDASGRAKIRAVGASAE